MRKLIVGTTLALSLIFAAVSSADTVPVTSLSGDFGATNSTLRLTPDGVNFGIYPTAESGGSLYFAGANGLTLNDVADLSYTFNYRALHEPGTYTAAPYMRIFLQGDTQDVILDPSHCATTPVPQDTDITLQMVGNSVRYSDDGCDGIAPDEQPWANVLAAHGTETVSGIYITQGFAVGDSFSADVPKMTFNGDTFEFGAPQAGPTGATGATGATGPAGTTTIVQQPQLLTQTVVAPQKLVGDTLRVLHTPRHLKGHRFVSARAWLLTPSGLRGLTVKGNAIQVDLRGKPVGNYNVRIKTTYVHTATGKRHVHQTFRNLSITLAK
jgi:hypothetical protein